MENLKFYKEEFPASLERISFAEALWDRKFPFDFKQFLLQYNGVIVYPNIPTIKATTSSEFWQLWGIARMLSIEDIILQKKHLMQYTWNDTHSAENLEHYNVDLKYLLAFAVAERGCYYINLDEIQYGQIYFACYQDWDGFVRIQTNSFTAFMNSLEVDSNHDYTPNLSEIEYLSSKIFDRRYFNTETMPSLGLQRFKEVFEFFGERKPPESGYPSVIQYYVDDRIKLEYLIEKGCSLEGLLNYTRDFDSIVFLIERYGLDLNKSYNGWFPLQVYTGLDSWSNVKRKYELMHKLLSSDYQLDLTVIDSSGDDIVQRLKKMVVEYEKYRQSDIKFWKSNPDFHQFLTSKKINNLIQKTNKNGCMPFRWPH